MAHVRTGRFAARRGVLKTGVSFGEHTGSPTPLDAPEIRLTHDKGEDSGEQSTPQQQ